MKDLAQELTLFMQGEKGISQKKAQAFLAGFKAGRKKRNEAKMHMEAARLRETIDEQPPAPDLRDEFGLPLPVDEAMGAEPQLDRRHAHKLCDLFDPGGIDDDVEEDI